MSQNIPMGKQQFFDINGKPLVGGKVFNYVVGTTTPLTTYQDSGLTVPNTNPVILDARGQCSMYGNGNYRQILQDSTGVQIWDQVILDAAANIVIPAKANSILNVQVFTTNGTYTPTTGMKNCYVKYCGGGGGSGVVTNTSASQVSAAGGGASGSYGEAWLTALQIGANKAITVGAGGTAGTGSSNGGNGGVSSMGVLLIAPGGGGSPLGPAISTAAAFIISGGIPGGVVTGGNVISGNGTGGSPGLCMLTASIGGSGGSTPIGIGGQTGASITAGSGYGAGAAGQFSGPSNALAKDGLPGIGGAFIIIEYS